METALPAGVGRGAWLAIWTRDRKVDVVEPLSPFANVPIKARPTDWIYWYDLHVERSPSGITGHLIRVAEIFPTKAGCLAAIRSRLTKAEATKARHPHPSAPAPGSGGRGSGVLAQIPDADRRTGG
jgi:hypothetical protein